VRVRDEAGPALAQSGPADPAGCQREQRLRQLVPLFLHELGIEHVQPDRHPVLNVIEHRVARVRADGEQDRAEREIGPPAGRDPEHDHHDPEEQEGGAEVLLQEEHHERDAPGHEQGREVSRFGEREGT
jgi:hypothetical protein